MKINELGSKQYYPEVQKPGDQGEQIKGAQKSEVGKKKSIDKVDIAGFSKQSSGTKRLFHVAKAKIQQVSDIRYEKIQAAKKNMEQGVYNQSEVLNVLAEKLAKNPDIQKALNGEDENVSVGKLSVERMHVIENRIKTGYYKKPEVVEKIATSILGDLNSAGENNS